MYKTCITCGEKKLRHEYYNHPRNADGYSNECKACSRRRAESRRRAQGMKARRKIEIKSGKLLCPDCNRWLPPSEFYADANKPFGVCSICKVCDNARRVRRAKAK